MKYVVRYETAAEGLARVAELFAAHRALWHGFTEDGTLVAIGPMADPEQGAMAVFATREAAEAFVAMDPFVTEGVVARWEILDWNEVLLP
jgi:uncharacterized protein YciI